MREAGCSNGSDAFDYRDLHELARPTHGLTVEAAPDNIARVAFGVALDYLNKALLHAVDMIDECRWSDAQTSLHVDTSRPSPHNSHRPPGSTASSHQRG